MIFHLLIILKFSCGIHITSSSAHLHPQQYTQTVSKATYKANKYGRNLLSRRSAHNNTQISANIITDTICTCSDNIFNVAYTSMRQDIPLYGSNVYCFDYTVQYNQDTSQCKDEQLDYIVITAETHYTECIDITCEYYSDIVVDKGCITQECITSIETDTGTASRGIKYEFTTPLTDAIDIYLCVKGINTMEPGLIAFAGVGNYPYKCDGHKVPAFCGIIVDETVTPTYVPTVNPTDVSDAMGTTNAFSGNPTHYPSPKPTLNPTKYPSMEPTPGPTRKPIRWGGSYNDDTEEPTIIPTLNPTIFPTDFPTENPSILPTWNPTPNPTVYPTNEPTAYPTIYPTNEPTAYPTIYPTNEPTAYPTIYPTNEPTPYPTPKPTLYPTSKPTLYPTSKPTLYPTSKPTLYPTSKPTLYPTSKPTHAPTWYPTSNPIPKPTSVPTSNPTHYPTFNPTPYPIEWTVPKREDYHPTVQEPSVSPTINPTYPTIHEATVTPSITCPICLSDAIYDAYTDSNGYSAEPKPPVDVHSEYGPFHMHSKYDAFYEPQQILHDVKHGDRMNFSSPLFFVFVCIGIYNMIMCLWQTIKPPQTAVNILAEIELSDDDDEYWITDDDMADIDDDESDPLR